MNKKTIENIETKETVIKFSEAQLQKILPLKKQRDEADGLLNFFLEYILNENKVDISSVEIRFLPDISGLTIRPKQEDNK